MKKQISIPLGKNRCESESHLLKQFDFENLLEQEQVRNNEKD